MVEEFHAVRNAENVVTAYKQLYGWGTLNTNVWLPSLSELVGIDPNHYDDTWGTYLSAMQGLNTSTDYHADVRGGAQFLYFQQYNTAGGGEALWRACNRQQVWLRTSVYADIEQVWQVTNATALDWVFLTTYRAVHPAVENNKDILRNLWYTISLLPRLTHHVCRIKLKQTGVKA